MLSAELAADVAEMRIDWLTASYPPGLQLAEVERMLGRDAAVVAESVYLDLLFSVHPDALIDRCMAAVAARLEAAARRVLARLAGRPRQRRQRHSPLAASG